jgi:beta-galactosidase/beta-glucuronidase
MTANWWRQPVDRREFLGVGGLVLGGLGRADGTASALLPAGVRAVWDLEKAHREQTATRERVCLNGLWRWQPGREAADPVPDDGWGYFKVPGFWPGNSNYLQEDCQTLYPHPNWRDTDLRRTGAAWYQRDLTVPETWAGRRITLSAEYVNSFAVVYVDGKRWGEVRFPAGEVDLSPACRPGGKHVLSLLVVALPLKVVLLSYTDTNWAREVKGSVERRGLCSDVHLVGTPATARVTDVKVDTSVRKREVTVSAVLDGLASDAAYALHVKIGQDGRPARAFASKAFKTGDLRGGRIALTEAWKPEKLWDVHTPQNTLTAEVSLVDAAGKLLDAYHPVRFGFREFWIDGRDFYLNGTRIYLSAVPLDSAQIGPGPRPTRALGKP